MLKIIETQCEYFKNPIGIDNKTPRFSWKLLSEATSTYQKAYQVIVKDENRVVWDSGRVESGDTAG
ncbi:hypothetical protein P22_3166 [Propionispora sp. 2/2-37]|uniref:glycoside hydrolase family 78 protein n=1 Tax=Propionispora sp. 2/2-37 TaxID=1677858 RepID=UPI0006BB8329|nr:hypothetical protein [Propionispora sp. 2/2-37]CUH97040.1 hypothetical protein P22_3166 [Propionispora sp. 2/2-37]